MKYKIIKPIAKIGAIKGSGGSEYTGTFPIEISNNTIAINTQTLNKWDGYEGTLTTLNNKLELNITNTKNNFDSIENIKAEQVTQNNDIATNASNINQVVEALRASTLVNYKGNWIPNTIAKLGEIWSYETHLYLCKVEITTNAPTTTSDFDLISSFEVNLDNYYTKLEIDTKLNNYVLKTFLTLNYYTNTQINTMFENYYTKPEIEEQFTIVNSDISNLNNNKQNSSWNLVNNLIYGEQYLDIKFTAPNNAKEMSFTGRFRDSSGAYYACGGTFININETIFIPTYKNGSTSLFVCQLQNNSGQKILRVFDVYGNPVPGPSKEDTFKVYWR